MKFSRKLKNKLIFIFSSIYFLLMANSKTKKVIFWGNSPNLNFGPGIRTRRLIKSLGNNHFKKQIIYMQSHWPWYELLIFIFISKLLRLPIIYNQNGIYHKAYSNSFWMKNQILIFSLINAKKIIYQSNFCKESIKLICNKYIWNLITKKDSCTIYNPCPLNFKENSNINKLKKFNIVISNSFSKDRLYYAKYILNLISKLFKKEYVHKINIIGPINQVLTINENNYLKDLDNVVLHGYLKQNQLKTILSQSNIGIHLNFADPCPNMVCEYLAHNIPVLVNKVGGAKEIAKNACIPIENKYIVDNNQMPILDDVMLSLKEIINAFESFSKKARDRSKELSIENYAKKHINIFSKI